MRAKPRGGALRPREALAAANDLQMSACRPGIPEQDPCRQEDVQDGPRGNLRLIVYLGNLSLKQSNGMVLGIPLDIPYRTG